MNLEAIKHVPLSEDAFAIEEDTIVIRLRVKKNDIHKCVLYYGDRVCMTNPIIVKSLPMNKVASDVLFDYYEAEVISDYTRICYYFHLICPDEFIFYVGGTFMDKVNCDRTEFFQFPYIRREEIDNIPEWAKSAIMYQIFPDSFATGKRRMDAEKKLRTTKEGNKVLANNGGTLLGIIDNIDYLVTLGINCIYLNPIFTASSYHKYDIIDYFSVDPCFGDNETLKKLVQVCHKNGIRVLLDGVFNHCGSEFFAFLDVLEKGEKSRYKDWFYKLDFPIRYETPPNYEAFAYVKEMPKLNTSNPEVVDYFCRVGTYWIEEADIDGWRLDVANEIDHEFWRTFRKSVRKVKPDAFLIGEIWEDSQIWLQGDQFDSTMNYRFSNLCNRFFAQEDISVYDFNNQINSMLMRYKRGITYAQMNLLDSHDVPRFLFKCQNDIQKFRLTLLFMLTFVGIPSIFYGDEKGITGETEFEYRKPMVWEDDEDSLNLSNDVSKLISIRKEYKAFIYGNFQSISSDDFNNVYIYCREYLNQKLIVVINNGDNNVEVQLSEFEKKKMIYALSDESIDKDKINLSKKSGVIINCS